ncbi:MAG: sulfatase [Planctomycetota bacterium]|nr:sulfatase [Planctomycetota bacterium]
MHRHCQPLVFACTIVFLPAIFTFFAFATKPAGAAEIARPNVVFILTDQWRGQATGYAGDVNAKTPNIDRLAGHGVRFGHAVSGCPVCSPYRGSLMTGRYPLGHGVFLNDVQLNNDAVALAQAFGGAGYQTAFIGKWHLDGHGRSSFIPPERRQGFQFWRTAECTHNYNHSHYYADDDEKKFWQGYDAFAQTAEARRYIERHKDGPFVLVLSLGPPHNPYQTAPQRFKQMFRPEDIVLRPNVPKSAEKAARRDLAGYYAHIAALDHCVGLVEATLKRQGLLKNTILVFTSDHGDMLGSHGESRKQRPWDESILVPLVVHWPAGLGGSARKLITPINAPDIMPTLLGLCGIDIPKTVEGRNRSKLLTGQAADNGEGAELITCVSPFGEWTRAKGGREYRGIRTRRYTFVRTLDGPWLLYDNRTDPYQQNNLCDKPQHAELQKRLDAKLQEELRRTGDEFLPGAEYVKKWGYKVNKHGTVRYKP